MIQSVSLLEVRGLRFAYGQHLAVNDASFEIRRGEIFGFLGPNGAGKTTAISCISGLLADWQGEILFSGQPFRPASNTEHRKRIGVVPQELAVYEGLTGRENLMLFGRLSGLDQGIATERTRAALSLAGLTDRADDRVAQYSGGMKRRLNLAAGDLHSPELLLLDEPTVGVDPQSRNHIFDSLGELRRSGRTLLFTTHYMEEAERLCDKIAIINDGKIVAAGTAAELGQMAGVPGENLETIFLQLTGRSLRD